MTDKPALKEMDTTDGLVLYDGKNHSAWIKSDTYAELDSDTSPIERVSHD